MAQIYEHVENLVEEKFNTTMGYAGTMFDQATTLLNSLGSAQVPVTLSTVVLNPVASNVTLDIVTPPTADYNNSIDKNIPAEPVLYDSVIEVNAFSENNLESPVLTIPDVPEFREFTLPDTPEIPTIGTINAITITTPVTPSLQSIVIPTTPAIDTPELNLGIEPTFDELLVIPDFDPSEIIAEVRNIVLFFSEELALARDTIIDFIKNPKMAMGEVITEQIRSGAMAKIADEYAPRYIEANTFFSSRGWNIPQGVLVSRVSELDRLRIISEDNVERDLAIKNFELSQQNMLAAFQMLPQYTGVLVSASTSILQQVIEISKYTFEAALAKYRALFDKYKTQVEVYKTKIEIYQLKIEAQKLRVEMYSTEVNAAKLTNDVNSSIVNLFKLQIEIENTKLQVYKLEIEDILARISQNKALIEMYSAEISAYIAGVSTNNAKVQLYATQMSAEDSKIKIYGAQVQAYSVLIDTEKTQALVAIEEAKTNIENNKVLATLYEARIKGYSAELQAQLGTNEINAKLFAGYVGLYEASSRTNTAKSEIAIKEAEVNARMLETSTDIALKQADINMRNILTSAQIQVESIKGASMIAAQLSASALSAVSAGVQLSASSQEIENV